MSTHSIKSIQPSWLLIYYLLLLCKNARTHLLEDQALFKEIYSNLGSNTKEFSFYLSASHCAKSSIQFLDPDTTAASTQTGRSGTCRGLNWHVQSSSGSAKASKHGADEHKMHTSTCKLNHTCFTDLVLEKQKLRLITCKTGGCPWQWRMISFVAKKCSVRANWCLNCTCYTYPTCADTGKWSRRPLVLLPPFS